MSVCVIVCLCDIFIPMVQDSLSLSWFFLCDERLGADSSVFLFYRTRLADF